MQQAVDRIAQHCLGAPGRLTGRALGEAEGIV
jgi:hypothetical protein